MNKKTLDRKNFREIYPPWSSDYNDTKGLTETELAAGYRETFGPMHSYSLKKFLANNLVDMPVTFIDFGSGPGILLDAITPDVKHRYFFVDRSRPFLNYIKKNFDEWGEQKYFFESIYDLRIRRDGPPLVLVMSYLLKNRHFEEEELRALIRALHRTNRQILVYVQDTTFIDLYNVKQIFFDYGFYKVRDWTVANDPRYSDNVDFQRRELIHGIYAFNEGENLLQTNEEKENATRIDTDIFAPVF